MDTLFPLHDVVLPPATAGQVRWSYSKRGLLFQCPRKYYYHYYGASSRTAHEDCDKNRLRELKPITNLHLRAGDIVDLVIRSYFKRPNGSGYGSWNSARLVSWALSILAQDREFNISQAAKDTSEFPSPRLWEYYRSFSDAEERYQAAMEKIRLALTNFAISDAYRLFRSTPQNVQTQETITTIVDGATAKGKIDLSLSEVDCHHILDWKIGSEGSGDDHLQVGFYGLWASTQSKIRLPIKLHMAYLAGGTLRTYSIPNDVRPRQVRARITQDLIIMRNLHPYGLSARKEAFTPCLQPKICEMCQYEPVCSPRKRK